MQVKVLFLVGAFLWATKSDALNYVFDEYLFSKDTWFEWKVENPLAEFNPTDLLPKAREKFPGFDSTEYNSLDGPRKRLQSRKTVAGGLASDVEAIDDEGMLEHAAKAAQCTACHVLVTVTWARITGDLLSGESVTPQLVRGHMAEACEKDALDSLLRKYTLLKMESGGVLFFVVRERRGGAGGSSATDAEEAAMLQSCKGLLRESGSDLVSVLLEQLANYRREALRLLLKHGRDGGSEPEQPAEAAQRGGSGSGRAGGSGSSGLLPRLDAEGAGEDDDDEYVDPDELDEGGNVVAGKQRPAGRAARRPARPQGPAPPREVRALLIKADPGQPECTDLNHKCGQWAAAGECELNPNYMIGNAVHKGHCRKSCGMCSPLSSLSGSPGLLSELEALSAALLLAAKNLGCGASGACLSGVSGMAAGQGLVRQPEGAAAGGKKELPPGMKELPGGFVLGKPWWGIPDVRPVPRAQRKPVPGADGVPVTDRAADATGSGSGSGGGSPPSHSEVDRVLAPALAHRLLSVPSDFFTYEYLYKNHTRHFHADKEGFVTEDWLLGKFSRESVSLMSSATGEVAGLEDLDLLPGGSHSEQLKAHIWPYVKQVYAGGDECVLGGGRRVVRRVEARIACSPDSNTYMLVREPDFCTYTFVIYVPQLCTLEYYRPRLRAPAGAGGGGAGGRASKQPTGPGAPARGGRT